VVGRVPETPKPFLRRTWVRRAVPAGAVAVLVVVGTVAVRTNASASPIDTYRTTSVAVGSVEQRLNLTGSVQQVNQVSEGFAVAGTVSNVLVSVGDAVKAGQTLATLDPGPLTSAVTAAKATLAQAKATLESDQAADAASASTASAAPAPAATPTPSPSTASPSAPSGAGADQSVARAQLRVSSAQKTVAADLGLASAALAKCAPFFPSESPTPSPTDSSTPAPTSSS
jgi:multidrug efflux pump subunit AcrA (membrane-fusion protein)